MASKSAQNRPLVVVFVYILIVKGKIVKNGCEFAPNMVVLLVGPWLDGQCVLMAYGRVQCVHGTALSLDGHIAQCMSFALKNDDGRNETSAWKVKWTADWTGLNVDLEPFSRAFLLCVGF